MDSNELLMDEIGEEHICTNFDTPLRPDAFLLSDEEKIKKISHYFKGNHVHQSRQSKEKHVLLL
jgi:hypothetical protein